MKVVVTGAYGLVGANLVRTLLGQGHTVTVADIRTSLSLEGLDVEHVDIDVLEQERLVEPFRGADVVYHLAAVISITGDPTGLVQRRFGASSLERNESARPREAA
jgi:dihydroflavonol-4-reductase